MAAQPDSDLFDVTDERFSLAPLARAALWAGLAALAVFAAVLAARSETGSKRIAALLDGADPPAASPAAPPTSSSHGPSERTIQSLMDTVEILSRDVAQLASRIDALEHRADVTSSVPQPAEAAPAASPVPTVNRTEFGLDLGPGASLDALRSLWATLRSQNAGLLDGLRPLAAIREDVSGVRELRLIAGPVGNAAIAARLCAAVSANGRACQPATFEGQRLALR
jgi:hypothetical protein